MAAASGKPAVAAAAASGAGGNPASVEKAPAVALSQGGHGGQGQTAQDGGGTFNKTIGSGELKTAGNVAAAGGGEGIPLAAASGKPAVAAAAASGVGGNPALAAAASGGGGRPGKLSRKQKRELSKAERLEYEQRAVAGAAAWSDTTSAQPVAASLSLSSHVASAAWVPQKGHTSD